MSDDIKRCDGPDDPNRCQAVRGGDGDQCMNAAAEHSTFCMAHGGNRAAGTVKKQETRNYRKSKWLARIHDHADSAVIKSLREEIGILRIIMEERLALCKTEMDFILYSAPIQDTVMKIAHLVESCHKLEDKLKVVVDRAQLLQFASMVINIVGSEITDDEVMESIGSKILAAVGKLEEDDV